MNPIKYLYAAYIVTWLIHIGYLIIMVRKYSRLKDEIGALRKK